MILGSLFYEYQLPIFGKIATQNVVNSKALLSIG